MSLMRLNKTLREDEAGQTLVLGALTMLIVALSVMVTVNLGQTIHKRVRVQDAADAAAYGQAVMAARTLNYVAFTNRAIVAQYVAMMAAQSLISHAAGMVGLLQLIQVGLDNLGTILRLVPPARPYGEAIKRAAKAFEIMAKGMDYLAKALELLIAPSKPIGYFHQLVALNQIGMYEASYAVLIRSMRALVPVGSGGDPIASRMRKDNCGFESLSCDEPWHPVSKRYKTIMAAHAGYSMQAMFLSDSFNPMPKPNTWWGSGSEKRQRAERLMAEIVNASRTKLVSHRKFSLLGAKVDGTTRFVNPMSSSRFQRKGSNFAFITGADSTQLTRGPALAAGDHFRLESFPLSWLGWWQPKDLVAGVNATPANRAAGYHCRDLDKKKERLFFIGPKVWKVKGVRCISEPNNHYWSKIGPGISPLGAISKYVAFEPSSKGKDLDGMFNQRTFLGLTAMSPAAARFPLDVFGFRQSGDFTWDQGGGDLKATWSSDETAAGKLEVTQGLNGWARARVYYHRPGFWAEPPNVFNPYWKAKLSPMTMGAAAEATAGMGGRAAALLPAASQLLLH